jgi:sugar lactone lactonase YvrE
MGVFQVTLTASNSGGSSSAILTLTVSQPPYCFSHFAVTPPTPFNSLARIASGGPGLFYITDSGGNTVYKFDSAGTTATVWAGQAGVPGTSDGAGTAAQFNSPTGLAVDGSGNVYVADTANSTIRKISSSGVVTTLAGVPGEPGAADGAAGSAHFNYPEGVAVDSSGKVYVADTLNSTIRQRGRNRERGTILAPFCDSSRFKRQSLRRRL